MYFSQPYPSSAPFLCPSKRSNAGAWSQDPLRWPAVCPELSSEAVSWTLYKYSWRSWGWICRGCQTHPQRRSGPWQGEWQSPPARPEQPMQHLLHMWSPLQTQRQDETTSWAKGQQWIFSLWIPQIRNMPKKTNERTPVKLWFLEIS